MPVQCRCPKGCGHSGHPNLSIGDNVQISGKNTPDPAYDADKGTPYRQTKKRARYLLNDFSDAHCRTLMETMIDTAPEAACAAIASYFEREVEGMHK